MSGISPQQKKDPKKREKEKKEREKKEKKEQGLKSKRGEQYEEAPCFKRRKEKKRLKFTSYWERFYRKKEKKGDHILL
jgi:hypothetical protein